ncbi:MAG: lysine methyltransferase [Segetibacter sp.]|nr:lysine methyltransferase [Segetibacter sp.]
MSFPLLYFKETKEKGRGVFSANEIEEKVLIEKCPVIFITSAAEINLIACTSLLNYAFRWNTEEEILTIALGFGSLYNHSSANNAFYKMNLQENTIDIIAFRTIKPGEEVTINYVASGTKDAKKWFEDRGIEYVE